MRFLKQLELDFASEDVSTLSPVGRDGREAPVRAGGTRSPSALIKNNATPPPDLTSVRAGLAFSERPIRLRRCDHTLERQARELLIANGAARLANEVRVEWSPRLKSCAGRADFKKTLISL